MRSIFRLYQGGTLEEYLRLNKVGLSVSGYILVLDDNTLRMQILGCEDPLKPGGDAHTGPDLNIKTAPADVLNQVPNLFRKGSYTFLRQSILKEDDIEINGFE